MALTPVLRTVKDADIFCDLIKHMSNDATNSGDATRIEHIRLVRELLVVESSEVVQTVTQSPAKTSAVTINGTLGVITLVQPNLSANSQVEFVVNNSSVLSTSLIITSLDNNSSQGLVVNIKSISNGSFEVIIRNNSNLGAFSSTTKLHFMIK